MLSHETDTEQSPRQSTDFIYASSDLGQLDWSSIYFRFTWDLNLAPRAVLHQEPILPSQESVNLSLTFPGTKGNAALN